MSDIGRQLERLKSPNRNTRWDACEELRIAETLPAKAFTALELAAEDEDAVVVAAARRALLTHRPLPSRSQEDAEIANQQELCPHCGRSWVTIDWRYGNRLKRNTFVSRAARSLPVWVGALVLIFLQFMGERDFHLKVFSVLALLGFAMMLVVVYRQVYGRSSAGRYPGTRSPVVLVDTSGPLKNSERLRHGKQTRPKPRPRLPTGGRGRPHGRRIPNGGDTGNRRDRSRGHACTTRAPGVHQGRNVDKHKGESADTREVRCHQFPLGHLPECAGRSLGQMGHQRQPDPVPSRVSGDTWPRCLDGSVTGQTLGGNTWRGVTIGIWIGAVASIVICSRESLSGG